MKRKRRGFVNKLCDLNREVKRHNVVVSSLVRTPFPRDNFLTNIK